MHLLTLLGITLGGLSATGILVNRTIDDMYGDQVTGAQVAYMGKWGHTTQGDSRVYNKSVSEGASEPTKGDPPAAFSFQFTGVAVYVYGVLAGSGTLTNFSITVDGHDAGRFVLQQGTNASAVYNASIFSQAALPYAEHNVMVQTVHPKGSLIVFDYAVYTTNTSASDFVSSASISSCGRVPPSNTATKVSSTDGGSIITVSASPSKSPSPRDSSKKHLTTILSALLGGGFGVIALFVAVLVCKRGRKARGSTSQASSFMPVPYNGSSNPQSLTREEKLPTTAPHQTIPEPAHGAASAVALREQLQFFRSELQVLRARHRRTQPKPALPEGLPPSFTMSVEDIAGEEVAEGPSLAQEIHQLRGDIAELRGQHQNMPSFANTLGPASDDVQRELALLRAEIEELRIHQYDDPLPEYSPSPLTS